MRTARDMTSDDQYMQVRRAVHSCSDWYFPTPRHDESSRDGVLSMNTAAVQSILRVAKVRSMHRTPRKRVALADGQSQLIPTPMVVVTTHDIRA